MDDCSCCRRAGLTGRGRVRSFSFLFHSIPLISMPGSKTGPDPKQDWIQNRFGFKTGSDSKQVRIQNRIGFKTGSTWKRRSSHIFFKAIAVPKITRCIQTFLYQLPLWYLYNFYIFQYFPAIWLLWKTDKTEQPLSPLHVKKAVITQVIIAKRSIIEAFINGAFQ